MIEEIIERERERSKVVGHKLKNNEYSRPTNIEEQTTDNIIKK